MGVDVSLLLVLALGQVVLAVLAPGAPLAILGDLGELLLGLGELPLLEQLEGRLEFGVGLRVGRRLGHGAPAVGTENEGRGGRIAAAWSGSRRPGREPALEEVRRVGRTRGVRHLFGGDPLEQVVVVSGAPLGQRAGEALATGRQDRQ